MALWRNRELEQIIGGPLDAGGITAAGLQSLVDEIPAESDIVDYKSKLTLLKQVPAEGQKKQSWTAQQELAKDVCGPANSRGGIVVFGIEDHKKFPDDPTARFEPFTGADGDASDLIEKVRRDVRQHATPLPRFDVVTVATDSGSGYYLVLVIPPSPSAPHAVTVAAGESRKPLHYLLRQPGETSIRPMTEYEVAEMYAARARRGQTRRDELDEVWNEGANNITDSGGFGVWIAAAAVPEMPARDDGRLTAQARAEIHEWATASLFPESILGRRYREEMPVFPAPGRLIYEQLAADGWDEDPVPHAARSHEEIYADGSAYCALRLASDPGTSDVWIEGHGLVDDIQAVVRRALGWLCGRTGQWGEALVRIGIIAPGVDLSNPFVTRLTDDNRERLPGSRPVQRDRLPSAVVALDLAEAVDLRGRLAAAYSAALPIVQAFAIAEPGWITPAGDVDPAGLTGDYQAAAATWASRHQVFANVLPPSPVE